MKKLFTFIALLLALGCGDAEEPISKSFEPGVVNPQSVEAQLLINNPWCVNTEIENKDGSITKAISMTIFRDLEGNARALYFEDGLLLKSYRYQYKLNYPLLTWGDLNNPIKKEIELTDDNLIIKNYYKDKKRPHLDLVPCEVGRL